MVQWMGTGLLSRFMQVRALLEAPLSRTFLADWVACPGFNQVVTCRVRQADKCTNFQFLKDDYLLYWHLE